jgi:hypothetical protein
MACMGFAGDSDPRDEEPECPDCGGGLDTGRGFAKCIDPECGFEWEQDCEPVERDYSECEYNV